MKFRFSKTGFRVLASIPVLLFALTGCSSSSLETSVGPFCSTGICMLEVQNNGNSPVDLFGELCGVVDGATYQSVNGFIGATVNPGQKAYFEFSVFGALDDTKFTKVYLGDCSNKSSILSWDVREAVSNSLGAGTESEEYVEPSPTVEAPAECAPGILALTPIYEDGNLSYVIENSGPECTFNIGSRVTFFHVSTGDSIVWSSRDCDRSAAVDLIRILQPGAFKPLPSESVEFPQTYSSEAGCGADVNEPLPAGIYYLNAEISGLVSEDSAEFRID